MGTNLDTPKTESLRVTLRDGSVVRIQQLPGVCLYEKVGPVDRAGHLTFRGTIHIPLKAIATMQPED